MGATNSRERTVVTLPEENPEIEPLAGASERQGATVREGSQVGASRLRWKKICGKVSSEPEASILVYEVESETVQDATKRHFATKCIEVSQGRESWGLGVLTP